MKSTMISSSRRFVLIVLCGLVAASALAYDALPRRATSIAGNWVLNEAQSDDVEKALRDRLDRERERYRRDMERWRRAQQRDPALPPPDAEDPEMAEAARAARERMQRRHEREMDQFRRMLNVTRTLQITQEGARIEIVSAVETRRFDAGSKSHVSMPEGQLADLSVGWDGAWFVVERRTRRGPDVVERFRHLPKTDQLEYRMSWRGETELAGIDVKRIFNRSNGDAVRRPEVGPVR